MALESVKYSELDRRVQIYSQTQVQSTTGAVTTTATLVATVFTRVKPGAGDERMETDKPTNVGVTEFRIRYRALSYTDTLRYDGVDYEIVNIQEVGRKQALDLKARRRL